jgi:methylated-DNA-[protein]-cysteine S-methyltransferase
MKTKIIKATPFGPVALVWSEDAQGPKIACVALSRPGMPAESRLRRAFPDAPEASCVEVDAVAAGIKKLLEGEAIAFSLDIVNLGPCSGFQQRVLRAEHAIPRGSVSTYGLIAAHLGKPGGARAVGNALAGNPFPLIIPCHRAVSSDRSLGGYQGGPEMKQALLKMEGIPFDDSGRVDCVRFHYGEGRRGSI